MRFAFIFALLALSIGASQELPPVSAATDYARLHAGLNPPKLLHSVDPEYTSQALMAGIEGAVVLEVVINAEGKVTHATVLSPLPAGLDRKALAAVKQWRYSPGVMDAENVPVLMTVDVLFKLPYRAGEENTVKQAKAFQAIWERELRGTTSADDVKQVKDLAAQGLLRATALLGKWKLGEFRMAKDVAGGLADLKRAEAANEALALWILGHEELKGGLMQRNETHGWQMIQRAAFLGSTDASAFLAERDERDGRLNDAKWKFRTCAARGVSACQFRLGKLLVSGPGVNPNEFAQGVAWLDLARDHGYIKANELYATSVDKLSSIQMDWVAVLKPHLELRSVSGF